MDGRIPNDLRDQIISLFRERICDKMDIAPFVHQRECWAAFDGMTLLDIADPMGAKVLVLDSQVKPEDVVLKHVTINGIASSMVTRMLVPRAQGRARFASDLGSFKIGKSYGAALWGSGFAAVPDSRLNLVGLEYDICAPEFDYICEFLLSEQGMGLKYDSLQNRPRDGKMWLDLANGARYEARSWERKDSLKGKEIDAYIYCEAYQLPGIECFTSFSQNLRARKGYAFFPTTPDRPWVMTLHDLGHGADPEWHCTCDVPAEANPFTFDPVAKERDRTLMTREKFAIHYEGKLGDFVGRVFNYQRGARQFHPGSHPELFVGEECNRQNLRIPEGWELVGGADTGSYYSSLLIAFSPSGDAFVVEEFPNYRYVAGSAERDESLTIPNWAKTVSKRMQNLGGRSYFWADKNSQFKSELSHYGLALLPAAAPVEARTEITREYFEKGRIWLAPWLEVLPFELENAAWPEEASSSGKFARVKDRDHTLDCLEHVLARRPVGRGIQTKAERKRWMDTYAAQMGAKKSSGNAHLGKN